MLILDSVVFHIQELTILVIYSKYFHNNEISPSNSTEVSFQLLPSHLVGLQNFFSC